MIPNSINSFDLNELFPFSIILQLIAELEHRQRQIAAELNKGFEHASRYEELRLRLITLNKQLTESGAEIDASPELSSLDEEAFQSAEPGISVRQILSLTGKFVDPGEEKAKTLDSENPILYFEMRGQIYLLYLFDKRERADLDDQMRKALASP